MNSLFFLQIHREFSVWSANLLLSTQIYHEFTISHANSLQFSVLTANLVRLHVMFRGFTMNHLFFEIKIKSISFLRIHYLSVESFINVLGVWRFTMDFREITMNSLSSCEFTMNSLSFSRIYYEFSVWSAN